MPTIYGPNQLAALYTASATPVAGTLALRDGSGRVETATPAASSDATTKAYVDAKTANPLTITGTATLLAGGHYLFDATSASFLATLPLQPVHGTKVFLSRTDQSTNAVTYVASTGDTIEGSTATFTLIAGADGLELTFNGTTRQWLRRPRAAVQAPPWAGTGLFNQFDPRRSVYNWKSSNTRWLRRGLAMAARGGRSDQVVFGDSISSGAVSNIGTVLFDRPNAWPMAMRNALAGMGVPIGGSGMVRIIDQGFVDARYTSTGTWSSFNYYSFSTTVGSTMTYSPDVSGSMLEMRYYDGGSGTFTITVNGVVVRTITGSGVGTAWKTARVTGQNIVANQSKIVLTVTVAGTGVFPSAINVFTPNSGLLVHNLAQSGSRVSGQTGNNSWTDTTTTGNNASPYTAMGDAAGRTRQVTDAVFTASSATMTSATAAFTADDIGQPVDQYTVPTAGIILPENTYIAGYTNATTVTLNAPAYVSATAQTVNIGREPHVVHLALGGNDLFAGFTLANVQAALTTMRNRFPNSDCILHLFHNPSTTLASQAATDAFAAGYYALADTLDIPLFDWRDRIGTYAQGQASGVYGDYQVHLKGSGYAMIGSLMAEIIGESAGKTQGNYTPTQDIDFTTKKYVDDRVKSTTTVNVATVTTTVETVVLSMPVPANAVKVGSAYDYVMALKPAIATGTTVRVRIGTAGTIADAAVVTMSVTPAQTSALARICRGVGGVSVIGASAAHTGVGEEAIHAIVPAVGSAGAITTAGTFDSTKDNIITVTVQNGTSTTTTVTAARLELTY